jgi:N-acetylglucosamine-6-phosphate deacetylase
LEVGKRADFVITDGPLFEAETDILETWIDGAAYRYPLQPTHDVRGSYRLTLIDQQGEPRKTTLRLGGSARKLQGVLQFKNAEQRESEVRLLGLRLEDRQLIAKFPEKAFGGSGMAQLSLTLLIDGQATPEEQVLKVIGQVGWSNQPWSAAHGKRLSSEVPIVSEVATNSLKAVQSNDNSKTDSPVKAIARVTYPFGAHGRLELAKQESPVLIRNASLWTCGPQGIVERGSLLIEGGKIVRVVAGELEVEDGVLVIDADGKHLTPGLIDCHSHIATDGGVNESSQAITCEVRVQDFIDSDHQQIYRQLAGGVTAINILHGSANPIGGQNQVIKLRWGESPDQLRMKEAPPGVKFALGENVKQSSLSEMGTRYPQSRMGVEQILRDAFQTAREYERRWQQYQENHDLPLPRRDLELEALVEILQGKRLVHCHSYRQDEILMLLRLCDEFGIRIATLQHILEGYKVADAMARHGAAGSSFSDWWAYKIEVYDAIPFNGALMHQAGVNVSFNSDDSELARHLNHEAAKAMKYGGVSAEEALKFVTLNPAKQLRIDAHVGSLEEGKQADLVVWSGPPLSMMSRCEQTWIDGKKYFDLVEDEAMRQRESILKSQLVQKILDSGAAMKTEAAENSEKTADESWLRYDEFCQTSMSGDAR